MNTPLRSSGAGYSGKPLPSKLGLKPGMRFVALNAPPDLDVLGMIWIAWPKKASGLGTELTESVVRRLGLATGLVDVKVCAVDATWSGLKFVRRLRDRRG